MEPLSAALAFCVPLTVGPIPDAPTVVDAFVEAYNRHDIEGVAALVAADARFGHPEEPLTGAEVVGRYKTIVFPRFPKVKTETLSRLAAGDLVAQTEHSSGIGAEGETGLSVYRVDRGCIVGLSINKTPDEAQ